MTARKHRIAAIILLTLCVLAVAAVLLEAGRVGWDWQAATSFGRRGSTPLWFATAAMSLFATVMAIGAVWQLRLSRR